MLSIVALLSVPNIFMRPKEAAKAADEAKAQFAHIDGSYAHSYAYIHTCILNHSSIHTYIHTYLYEKHFSYIKTEICRNSQ